MRWLTVIRRSATSHVFTSIVHVFVCSRIDYCNSLLVGFQKVRNSPLQSVLNAAVRLIARLPRTSHISAFMFDHLHLLVYNSRFSDWWSSQVFTWTFPRAFYWHTVCHRPLRSLDRHDLFDRRASSCMAQTRAFAIIGINSLPWHNPLY